MWIVFVYGILTGLSLVGLLLLLTEWQAHRRRIDLESILDGLSPRSTDRVK